MQFSLVALSAVLATGVYAIPAPLFLRQDTCEIAGAPKFASFPAPLFIYHPDCVLDLAPSVITCTSAAAQGGAGMSLGFLPPIHVLIFSPTDPFTNTLCLVDAAKDVVEGLPASCSGCLAEFGINPPALSGVVGTIEDGLESAGSTIEGGLESAGSAIESGLSSLGDIFK